MMKSLLCLLLLIAVPMWGQNARYVDPRIGSEGLGRVAIGPCCPFGMVKPSPDCTSGNNAGWAPMPEQVNGFGQVHVSGTGGGCKYGNILLQPFSGELLGSEHIDYRNSEDIQLGYYATTYQKSGIQTEITAGERASLYRFTYPSEACLLIDAGFYLGETSDPKGREAQQFVGSQIQILSDHEVSGYSRIRGGWNDGKAYTVYFYAETDVPMTGYRTWHEPCAVEKARHPELGTELSTATYQVDNGAKTGALLSFGQQKQVVLKVGISFVSELKARENAQKELSSCTFEQVRDKLCARWDLILNRIELDATTSDAYKRMFYTGIYHAMMMPVDRTGENPGWSDSADYFDDFYAIWDTYRTSTPLITLLDPEREVQIVNALLNIYDHDGYLPDARSGNSNGRTQGGSNAEIVIADALAKGLTGIDYGLALNAMLKDATTPPGGNEEAEGRGGLLPYLEKGYIPYGIPRAGNRTVEYSFCDWAIAQVARHLGKEDLYNQYMQQSRNWKNLWRKDYVQDGVSGFIMPRDAQGNWLDEIPFGHSKRWAPTFIYTPDTSYEGPWYMPWWSCFMYEASSWEYSLSIPHDIPGLIEACGGAAAFEKRLDTFFDNRKGYFNVANEPSFLTPCLYNFIGKPDKTGDLVERIIRENYNDTPIGIPGNDDSGSMSSWLAFHMLGIYPNAGHNYYLIHKPLVKSFRMNLSNGKVFSMRTEGMSEKNPRLLKATWNGQELPGFQLTHQQILEGGELVLTFGKADKEVEKQRSYPVEKAHPAKIGQEKCYASKEEDPRTYTYQYVFKLHGQTRRFAVSFEQEGDNLVLYYGIQRNLLWWTGSYTMPPLTVENASRLSYVQPLNHQHITLDGETFGILSRKAYREVKTTGKCQFNNTEYQLVEKKDEKLLLRDVYEGAEMQVADDERLPIIWKMQNNPTEINWQVEILNQ